MKQVDSDILSISFDAIDEMDSAGYRRLDISILEKDALVTEVIHTLAKTFGKHPVKASFQLHQNKPS